MTIQKSKERIQKNGEVFTPRHLADKMLDKIDPIIWKDSSKTFCDPAAGDGNLIIAILERRLSNGISKEDSIKTLYAVELMQDNVTKMKQHIRDIIGSEFDYIIFKNIVCHDSLTWCFWGEFKKCSCKLCEIYKSKSNLSKFVK